MSQDQTNAPDEFAARFREACQRIAQAAVRAGRDPASVTLVAVSKTVALADIQAAYRLGVHTFGENRVQEAAPKIAQFTAPDLRWELIGQLQRNKVERALGLFARVQSVDSLRLAEALSAHARRGERPLPILLEVNIAGEASKAGFAPDELCDAARAISALPALLPEGLMTVAPLAARPEDARPVFQALARLRAMLRAAVPLGANGEWAELSMGMSDDFEVAIEEGATIVRLGRALFGARRIVQ